MDSQKKILLSDSDHEFVNAIKDGLEFKNHLECDFQTLFQLSPNGIFLFNDADVLLANKALLNIINWNIESSINLKLEELFDKSSLQKIKLWMKYLIVNQSPFNEQVILIRKAGSDFSIQLFISELQNSDNTSHFIGFLHSIQQYNPITNYQLANDVCNMLKRENIEITDKLEKKISQIIKIRTIDNNDLNNSFFTKRENEVLNLSMEGLSIKIIADKLSISSRTVEKYRTKLMEKSGAKNIVEVIVFALKNNLVKI